MSVRCPICEEMRSGEDINYVYPPSSKTIISSIHNRFALIASYKNVGIHNSYQYSFSFSEVSPVLRGLFGDLTGPWAQKVICYQCLDEGELLFVRSRQVRDLPLYINVKWVTSVARQEYEKRLTELV